MLAKFEGKITIVFPPDSEISDFDRKYMSNLSKFEVSSVVVEYLLEKSKNSSRGKSFINYPYYGLIPMLNMVSDSFWFKVNFRSNSEIHPNSDRIRNHVHTYFLMDIENQTIYWNTSSNLTIFIRSSKFHGKITMPKSR